MSTPHQSGFVSIIGKPNAGKSTLINLLVGEKVSIITYKAQTTRHRIFGILNDENYQIVFSDTPGIIKPRYGMQKAMMDFVDQSLDDGDVTLLIVDITDENLGEEVETKLAKSQAPLIVILNKVDLSDEQQVKTSLEHWQQRTNAKEVIPVSALKKFNTQSVIQAVLRYLPEGPAFYPKDQFTDKPEKFFAAEIIREKVFLKYQEEIPYSTEVTIYSFTEEATLLRISAEIYVDRNSQKGILIGKGGEALKRTGTAARKELEAFFGKKVFLELYVRVKENWRDNDNMLRNFGYTAE